MEKFSDEKINSILNYSKRLVDSLSGGVDDELMQYKYLIFAGMIHYYGREYIEEIYEAFKNTNLVCVNGEISDLFSKYLCVEESIIKEVLEMEPLAYLSPSVFADADGHIVTEKKNIYIADYSKRTRLELLQALIREYNKRVNSINNSISIKDNQNKRRIGLSFRGTDGSVTGSILEGSINVLQSRDIMRSIFSFRDYNISDEDMRFFIEKFSREEDTEVSEYDLLILLINPLYEDTEFRDILKQARITGKIDLISDLFDAKTQAGGFKALSDACDNIGIGSCLDYILEINAGITQDLVKKYTKQL